jgi:predicted acylesterase/phospholipase RssA
MPEDLITSAIAWLKDSKEKLRALATGQESAPGERPRVGLALAGGFARGIAHIGVLRALKQAGIPIDFIAGTSVGALIGACYCAGAELDDMQRIGALTNFTDLRPLDSFVARISDQPAYRVLPGAVHREKNI